MTKLSKTSLYKHARPSLNFVAYDYFLKSNSPDIFVLLEINLDNSIDSGNFPLRTRV